MSHNSILIWTSAHRASVLSICTVLCRRDLRPLPCLGQGCGTLGTVQSCQPPRVLGGNSRGSRTGRSGGAGSDPNSATSFNNHSEICFTLENTLEKLFSKEGSQDYQCKSKAQEKRLIYKFPQMLSLIYLS